MTKIHPKCSINIYIHVYDICTVASQLPEWSPISITKKDAERVCCTDTVQCESTSIMLCMSCGRLMEKISLKRENIFFKRYKERYLWKHYLISLKIDIAQVQYGRQKSKDGRLVFRGEVEDLHGSKQTQEVLCIILSCYPTIPSLYGEREKEQKQCFWKVFLTNINTLRKISQLCCTVSSYLVEVIVGLSLL